MVKTRRSSMVSSPPLMDRKRRRTLVQQESPHAAQIHERYTKKEICFRLIQELFCRGFEGYWYTLLPNGDGLADISHALGVEWRYLLPVLSYLGLITTTVTSMVKNTAIMHWQWIELQNAIVKYKRFEVSVVRLKHCTRSHFFVLVYLSIALLQHRFARRLPALKVRMLVEHHQIFVSCIWM